MHEGKKTAVRLLMQMEGLSLEEASQKFDRHSRVEQVREEAEQILGRRLPSLCSSKFIEAFCERAPRIGVGVIQQRFNQQSTIDNCRFLTDLVVLPGADAQSWFSIEVMGVEEFENEGVVSVLHTGNSPAKALATFVEQFAPQLESAYARGELHRLSDSELGNIILGIAKQINALTYHGTSLAGSGDGKQLATDGLGLLDVLGLPKVVPPYAPSDSVLGDMLMALGLDRANTSRLERFDALKETRTEQLESLVYSACRDLIGALGEARPVQQRSPLDIFRNFRTEEQRNSRPSQLAVAMAYVTVVAEDPASSSGQYSAGRALLEAAIVHARERSRAAEERVGSAPDFLKEKAQAQLEYYHYVADAIQRNRQLLEELLRK